MNAKQSQYFKIGLAVVLAVVFLGAVVNSVMTVTRASSPPPPPLARPVATASAQPAGPPTTIPRSAISPAAPAVAAATSETPQNATGDSSWPNFTVDAIIAYDPFAIAKAADATSVSKEGVRRNGDGKQGTEAATDVSKGSAAKSESPFTGRIHAVYQRGSQTAALVGSKTVRPGDKIEGAGRVVEVDQAGLMLEVTK